MVDARRVRVGHDEGMDPLPQTRDPHGRLVIEVTGSSDPSLLRWAGEWIERAGGEALDRFSAPDQKFWDYRLGGALITLHWIAASGLSVVAGDAERSTARQVREVALALRTGVQQRLQALAD